MASSPRAPLRLGPAAAPALPAGELGTWRSARYRAMTRPRRTGAAGGGARPGRRATTPGLRDGQRGKDQGTQGQRKAERRRRQAASRKPPSDQQQPQRAVPPAQPKAVVEQGGGEQPRTRRCCRPTGRAAGTSRRRLARESRRRGDRIGGGAQREQTRPAGPRSAGRGRASARAAQQQQQGARAAAQCPVDGTSIGSITPPARGPSAPSRRRRDRRCRTVRNVRCEARIAVQRGEGRIGLGQGRERGDASEALA